MQACFANYSGGLAPVCAVSCSEQSSSQPSTNVEGAAWVSTEVEDENPAPERAAFDDEAVPHVLTMMLSPQADGEVLEEVLGDLCESHYRARHSPFVECVLSPGTSEVGAALKPAFASEPTLRILGLEPQHPPVEFQFYGYGANPHAAWAEARKGYRARGLPVKFGIIEQQCGFKEVDVTHTSFAHSGGVYHLNPGPPVREGHPTAVASVFSFRNPSGDYELFPDSEIFVGNAKSGGVAQQCGSGSLFLEMLDWFVKGDVMLVNKSTSKCAEEKREALLLDWYARQYDWVVTVAAGQITDRCQTQQPTLCQTLNSVCVGGYADSDTSNGPFGDIGDDLALGLNGYFYIDPHAGTREVDREEPDITGHVVFDIPIDYQTDEDYGRNEGTSLAAPLALATFAESLNHLQFHGPGGRWQDCRVSEMTRTLAKFHAGEHPVQHPISCSTVADCVLGGDCVDGVCEVGIPRTTAPHHLMTSGGPGEPLGNTCKEPGDCAAGLTCLFGWCDENPGDEMTGWGGTSILTSIVEGTFSCPAGPGPDCKPTTDGSCGRPTRPEDAIHPDELGQDFEPSVPPGKSSISSRGFHFDTFTAQPGQHYRGVYTWASCPNYIVGPPVMNCSQNSECPPPYSCQNGLCFQQGISTHTVFPDMDLFIWKEGWEESLPVSYSRDDNTEAFEFIAPEVGVYHVWGFAEEEEFEVCDETLSVYYNEDQTREDGIWDFYWGEVLN